MPPIRTLSLGRHFPALPPGLALPWMPAVTPIRQLRSSSFINRSNNLKDQQLSSLVRLTHPDPRPRSHDDHNHTAQPLVFLLGWWRAHPSHLAKYTRLHLARGSPVAVATLPPHCAVAPLLGLRRALDDLSKGLDRALAAHPQRRWVVHTLSNNGPFAYSLLPHALTHTVPQAIHDSGPSLLTPEQLVRGTVGVAWPGGPDRVPAWAHDLARAYLRFPPHAQILDKLHQGLANMPACPTLVLGGLRDSIVLPAEIQEFVRRHRDSRLTRVEWMDAVHVQLLRQFPAEYTKLVNDFITNHTL